MLLPGGGFDRGDNLPLDAQVGKDTKRYLPIWPEVAHSFIQADHAFLYNILMICPYQEIAPCLDANQAFVGFEQMNQSIRITMLGE